MAETAVVVLFPELDALIGTLRRANTRDGAREMPPHATLLYPFADAGAVADNVRRVLDPAGGAEVVEDAVLAAGRAGDADTAAVPDQQVREEPPVLARD